jgi:hypothetical protein
MNIIPFFDVYENVKEIADVHTAGKWRMPNTVPVQPPRKSCLPDRLLAIAIASSLTFIPARVPVALVGGLRIDGQGFTESG